MLKKKSDSASPLFKIGCFLCYQKKVGNSAVTYFIDNSVCKVAKELNCFLYPAPKCQVMVANGGTINCSGKWHIIKLTMGEYLLNISMLYIPMGGANVVLGVQCLQSFGTVAFNFQEIFLKFFWEGKVV